MPQNYNIVGGADIVGAGGDADLESLLGTVFGNDGDEMSGADIVGARRGPSAAQKALFRQLAARNAHALVPRPVSKGREYTMGLGGPTAIMTLAAATISTQPQVDFKVRRLIIPSDFAGAIQVNDFKVGKNSQFAASNPVPGRMFSEFAVGVDLGLDTANVGQLVSIAVTNSSGATVNFLCAVIGPSVE